MILLKAVALVCFVTADNAASRRSYQTVMTGIMPGDPADGSAFKTTLCLCGRSTRQHNYDRYTRDIRFHFRLPTSAFNPRFDGGLTSHMELGSIHAQTFRDALMVFSAWGD